MVPGHLANRILFEQSVAGFLLCVRFYCLFGLLLLLQGMNGKNVSYVSEWLQKQTIKKKGEDTIGQDRTKENK